MKPLPFDGPVRQLFLFALLVLLATQAAISIFSWYSVEQQIIPELERKAETVGKLVNSKIGRALDYQIPVEKLIGVSDFFDDILKQNSDIAFLVLSDSQGQVLYVSGVGVSNATAALKNQTVSTALQRPEHLALRFAPTASNRDEKPYIDTVLPIVRQDRLMAVIHVGVEQHYIAKRISELRYDVGVILLTSLLIAFEVLLFVIARHFSMPLSQISDQMRQMAAGDFRQHLAAGKLGQWRLVAEGLNHLAGNINRAFQTFSELSAQAASRGSQMRDFTSSLLQQLRKRHQFAEDGRMQELTPAHVGMVRMLTFLFMSAEMLSRPFLPLYAGELAQTWSGAPGTVLGSLPVTVFLLGVALTMPVAGSWSDRNGRRRSFCVGAAMLACGSLASGLLPHFWVLVVARAITGIGYATMFMSCQGYVIDRTDAAQRTRGMASFVGAIMVAEICAPAVGGILADRIGYPLVFVASAIIALTAFALGMRILDNGNIHAARAGVHKQGGMRLHALLSNKRFLAQAILMAIPAKLIYSGFLIYLVPLLLTDLGNTKAEIGRYTMVYGISALALAPVFARITDRYQVHTAMVTGGAVLTGFGLLPIFWSPNPLTVLLGIAALGVGQAMSISPQLVLVTEVTHKQAELAGIGAVLGIFRLIERLGAAAGPALAGALAAMYGTRTAMFALGLFGLASVVLFTLSQLLLKEKE